MNWKKERKWFVISYSEERKEAASVFGASGMIAKRDAKGFDSAFASDDTYNRHTRDAGIAGIILTVFAGLLCLGIVVTTILALCKVPFLEVFWGDWSGTLFGVSFLSYILLGLAAAATGVLIFIAVKFFRSVWHFIVISFCILLGAAAVGSAIYAYPLSLSGREIRAVQVQIDALRKSSTIDENSLAAIEKAEADYEALTDEQKEKVENFEEAIANARAAYPVAVKLEAIRLISPDSEPLVAEAQAAYDELTAVQKELLAESVYLYDWEDIYKVACEIAAVKISRGYSSEQFERLLQNIEQEARGLGFAEYSRLANRSRIDRLRDLFAGYQNLRGYSYSLKIGEDMFSDPNDKEEIFNDEEKLASVESIEFTNATITEELEEGALACFSNLKQIRYVGSSSRGTVSLGASSVDRCFTGEFTESSWGIAVGGPIQITFENCALLVQKEIDLTTRTSAELHFIGTNTITFRPRINEEGFITLKANDLSIVLHEGTKSSVTGSVGNYLSGGTAISSKSLTVSVAEKSESAENEPEPTLEEGAPELTISGGDGYTAENIGNTEAKDGGKAIVTGAFKVNGACKLTVAGGNGGGGRDGTGYSASETSGDARRNGSGGTIGGNGGIALTADSLEAGGSAEILIKGGLGGNGGNGGRGGNSNDDGNATAGFGGQGGFGGNGGNGAELSGAIHVAAETSVTIWSGNGGNGGIGGDGGNGLDKNVRDNGGDGGRGGKGGDGGHAFAGSFGTVEGTLLINAGYGGDGGNGGNGGTFGNSAHGGNPGKGGDGGNAYIETSDYYNTSKKTYSGKGGQGGRPGYNVNGSSFQESYGDYSVGGNGGSIYVDGAVAVEGLPGETATDRNKAAKGGELASWPSADQS